jgi:hypothetical protein
VCRSTAIAQVVGHSPVCMTHGKIYVPQAKHKSEQR